MKINRSSTTKLALFSLALLGSMLAFSQNASALPTVMPATITTDMGFFDPVTLTGDSHVVGTVNLGATASAADVAYYINFMITMSITTTQSHQLVAVAR